MLNAWLLYRRDCKALDVQSMPLRRFQLGRQSLDCTSKKRKTEVNPAPVEDVKFDGVDHLPNYEKKRQI